MALKQLVVKDAITVRDDVLRTIKNGLIKQGVQTPYVGPASDWHITATALGNEIAVIGANAIVSADAMMPDSAVGTDLKRQADIFELTEQAAAGSVGTIVITASAVSPIETGRELTDAAGLRYEVTIGGSYANGATVPIRAIDTGDATNHAEGDILQWVSAPPYCSDKAAVGPGGLVNGIDAEDPEALRARVLAMYRNPPGAGNWEHVAQLAEESSPSVQKAFVFPAVQGPSTVHVAVAAAPTASSKARSVATATLNGEVSPYVIGKLPTHAYVVLTTVEDVDTDIAVALSIPDAPTANPPGEGGGWTNGTPWPNVDGTSAFRVSATSVTSSTVFTVDASTAPTPNVTRIAWLSPTEWKLYTALVTAYSGSAGAYEITIDAPFTGIEAGAYIWPECQNAQVYVDAILDAFALMGPGEKTTNTSALIRGFRHPTPSTAWPYSLGPAMLRAVTDSSDEVLAAQFLYRTDGTTTLSGASGQLTPQVPVAVTDAPRILVPRHIGFYPIP